MIVALTGIPGTGKSTVSKHLRDKDYTVLDINDIVDKNNLVLSYDTSRDTSEVDLPALNKHLKEHLKTDSDNNPSGSSPNPPSKVVFLEGHLAHLIDIVDLVIVLRCHPVELWHRLTSRDWSNDKISENLEAEMVDTITIESVDKFGREKTFEIDVTKLNPTEIMENILNIINGNVNGFEVGNIDWSEEILKWY
jgi:adenylate kinase